MNSEKSFRSASDHQSNSELEVMKNAEICETIYVCHEQLNYGH